MSTLPLFDYAIGPGSRRRDPDTSRAAANRRPPRLLARDRAEALAIHADHPAGLTDFELAMHMKRQQTSAGKRRGELRDAGLIAQTAQRRPSPSGSPAIVWRITPDGITELNKIRSAAC